MSSTISAVNAWCSTTSSPSCSAASEPSAPRWPPSCATFTRPLSPGKRCGPPSHAGPPARPANRADQKRCLPPPALPPALPIDNKRQTHPNLYEKFSWMIFWINTCFWKSLRNFILILRTDSLIQQVCSRLILQPFCRKVRGMHLIQPHLHGIQHLMIHKCSIAIAAAVSSMSLNKKLEVPKGAPNLHAQTNEVMGEHPKFKKGLGEKRGFIRSSCPLKFRTV